jgi:hypothetical protein
MKEQSFIPWRFLLVLMALAVSLSIYGPAYAFKVQAGSACWEDTVTIDSSGRVPPGTKFPAWSTLFAVHGDNFATVATNKYPGSTVPTYFSGTGQLDSDGNMHIVYAGAVDRSPNLQLNGVWNLTVSCNKKGKDCKGSYWGFYSYVNPSATPPVIGNGYNAGTFKQVKCPRK